MLLVVAASAPESLGGSVAAVALADTLRERLGPVAFASTDQHGAFARMYAERVSRGAVISEEQSPRGMRWIYDAPQVIRDANLEATPVLVCDFTGIGRLDLYRWPEDTLREMIAPVVQTIFVLISSGSDGANMWVERLHQHSDIAARSIVAVAPFAARSTVSEMPGSRRVSVPILERDAWAFMDRHSLPPRTAESWTGPGIGGLGKSRIREWRAAWGRIADLIAAAGKPIALPTDDIQPFTINHDTETTI